MHVDLSHPIETGMQTFPGDPDVRVEAAATHDEDGFHVESVQCGSHTGTHVDAPAHTEPGGETLDAYPVERFVFDAVRVDCRELGARERIPAARVPDADADLVAFWTGWDAHWGTDRYLDHPFLSPDAAAACADSGLAVGVDALNPDPSPSPNAGDDEPDGFQAHHALLGADCLILENLTGLGAA
ncbi:MAG: cyclase family protein, partial [Halobacterium sp.]